LTPFYLHGVGVLGPGLHGWQAARRILGGEQMYRYEAPHEPKPDLLPQNERRRGPKTVRWTVAVAQEALQGTGFSAAEAAAVFTSSSGDGETMHQICESLARPGREVSPTRFHNSVHNAAAGYWSIASGSCRTSVTLCGHDASFAAGLLEAAGLVSAGEPAVLLVAYDLPYPQPLLSHRPIREPLAVAMLFSAQARHPALAQWRISLGAGAGNAAPSAVPPGLESNPAAQALPLLAAVARGRTETASITFTYGQQLEVESQACF